MPVIGGRQSKLNKNNIKKEIPGVKVVKYNKPAEEITQINEFEQAEEIKSVEEYDAIINDTDIETQPNNLSMIKPIKRKAHLNSMIFNQINKCEDIHDNLQDTTSNKSGNSELMDISSLVDVIVTRMDEEFVSKFELESLVKSIVEKVLQEMLLEPNKKIDTKPKVIKLNKSSSNNTDSNPQVKVIGRKK